MARPPWRIDSLRRAIASLALTTLTICVAASSNNNTEPAPLVMQPSEYWEGNDGPWSTFSIRVGTPEVVTRVLPATAVPDTWIVLSQACATTQCSDARGGTPLYNQNQSATWQKQGYYSLYFESNLNESGIGLFGQESLALGLPTGGGPSLTGQVIAGIVDPTFWLGVLGINPQPTNFTNLFHPIPSLFHSLRSSNNIPSLTYSYTAGNQYSLKKVLGQLIFGGYDASRFQPNNITFPFADDVTRDLVVSVQSIESVTGSGRSQELLSGGSILAYIDSTVPYIVLPVSACQAFENAFGLVFDQATGLYLVGDALHNSLLAKNVSFTFTLGNALSGGATVPITLPYAAFDLQVSYPIVNGSSRYFPLKRASNDTQYTLGRTFLQEAYLTADYERSSFTVSQCVFNQNAQSEVNTIHALNYTGPAGSSGSAGANGGPNSGAALSPGVIAGIVVAIVVVILLILLLAFLWRSRKWPFRKRKPATHASELGADRLGHEADGRLLDKPYPDVPEADSKQDNLYQRPELGAGMSAYAAQRQGQLPNKSELPGGFQAHPGRSQSELGGSEAATEVEGSGLHPCMELPGSPVPVDYYGNSRAVSDGPSPNLMGRGRRISARSPPSRATSGAMSMSAASPISSPSPAYDSHHRSQTGSDIPLSEGLSSGTYNDISSPSPASTPRSPMGDFQGMAVSTPARTAEGTRSRPSASRPRSHSRPSPSRLSSSRPSPSRPSPSRPPSDSRPSPLLPPSDADRFGSSARDTRDTLVSPEETDSAVQRRPGYFDKLHDRD